MPEQLDQIHRLPDRARHELDELHAVLDAGHHVGTLATVVDGEPWVVPMLYARIGDRLYLHGSSAAGALRTVAGGSPVALSVTHLDGLVYAHTMFNQSALFRSAVVRGRAVPVPLDEKAEALTAMTEKTTPRRPGCSRSACSEATAHRTCGGAVGRGSVGPPRVRRRDRGRT